MRKLTLVILTALAGACGSGDGDGAPVATALTVAHASLGGSVTATDAAGLTGTVSCNIQNVGAVGAGYAVVVASTAPQVCGSITAAQARANSTVVVLGIARGRQGAAPAVSPGTYVVAAPPSPSIDPINQTASVAFAQVIRFVGPLCSESTIAVTGGSIEVVSNSGGTPSGRVNLNLDGGGTVTGTFVGTACATPVSLDVQQACAGTVPDLFSAPSCAP
jgi:hypothetical protein